MLQNKLSCWSCAGLLLVVSVTASSKPKRPDMPPLPRSLRSVATNVLTAAKLRDYSSALTESENLFKSGNPQAALDRLRAANLLRDRLVSDVAADTARINMRIAAACWMLSKPTCVVNSLGDVSDPDLQQARDSVRHLFATFHLATAEFLIERGNTRDAGCHALASINFEDTPETEQAVARTGIRSVADLVGSSLRERACENKFREKMPEPTSATEPYFDLIVRADSLARSEKWKKALAVLVNARNDTKRVAEVMRVDGLASLIAEADAAMLTQNYEEALRLLEEWIRQTGGTATPAETDVTRLGERGSRVKATIIQLHGLLALKNYKLGVSSIETHSWQDAIEHFRSSDHFLRLPENQLGIGRAHMQLVRSIDPFFQLGPTHLQEASTAFKEYLTRFPEAPNRDEVRSLITLIDREIARRRSNADIQQAIGLLMASAVMQSVGDMQRSFHDYLNSQRADFWPSNVQTYIEFGGGIPTTLVLDGQSVPLNNIANRSPAGFPNSDTMIHVFTELGGQREAPPLPVMPNWPGFAGSGSAPVVLSGPGGNVQPDRPGNQVPDRTPGSAPLARFSRPNIRGLQMEQGCIELLNKESELLELAGATKKLLAWTPLITLAGESNAIHAALFINNTDWNELAESFRAVNNIVLFNLATDARRHANSDAHFGNPKAKQFWNAMADFYASLAEDLH